MNSKPNTFNSYSGFIEQNYEYLVDHRAADAASSLLNIWQTSEDKTNSIITDYLQSIIIDTGIDKLYNKLHALIVLREHIKNNDVLLAILEAQIELVSERITQEECESSGEINETNT